MSAWMFDNDNMDRLLAAIEYAAKNGCPVPLTLLMGNKSGIELFKLNAEALRQRYGEDDEDYRAYDKKYKRKPVSIDEIQMCKTLHCFTYQCAEGNVPESTKYKELEAIEKWFDQRVGYNDGRWTNKANEARYNAAIWG